MPSTASLKAKRLEEFLIERGSEFHRRIVEGKKEWRCWSRLEWGTRKQKGRRGEFVGIRSDLLQIARSFRILKKRIVFCLDRLSCRGYQFKNCMFFSGVTVLHQVISGDKTGSTFMNFFEFLGLRYEVRVPNATTVIKNGANLRIIALILLWEKNF